MPLLSKLFAPRYLFCTNLALGTGFLVTSDALVQLGQRVAPSSSGQETEFNWRRTSEFTLACGLETADTPILHPLSCIHGCLSHVMLDQRRWWVGDCCSVLLAIFGTHF